MAAVPAFTRPEAAQIILDSLKYQHINKRITLYAYVIMENHMHYIATGPDLEKRVKEFKSFTAQSSMIFFRDRCDYAMLSHLQNLKLAHRKDSDYQLWEEGSHHNSDHER